MKTAKLWWAASALGLGVNLGILHTAHADATHAAAGMDAGDGRSNSRVQLVMSAAGTCLAAALLLRRGKVGR